MLPFVDSKSAQDRVKSRHEGAPHEGIASPSINFARRVWPGH